MLARLVFRSFIVCVIVAAPHHAFSQQQRAEFLNLDNGCGDTLQLFLLAKGRGSPRG